MLRHLPCVAFSAFVAVACSPGPGGKSSPENAVQPVGEVLFSESPASWFEAYFTWLDVSPDGERALFDYRRLIDLRTGEEVAVSGGLDAVFRAQFDSDGSLMIAGRRGNEQGWFRLAAAQGASGTARRDATLPARFVLEPSPDGERFAYWMDDDPETLLIVARSESGDSAPAPQRIPVPAPIAGLAWMPDGAGVLAYTVDDAGVGTLRRIDASTGAAATVAEGLDGPWRGVRIAVNEDGRTAFVALAGPDAPDPEARHRPDEDRDLDIWAVDLASGKRRTLAEAPGEQVVPAFAAGALYWVSIDTKSEVALLHMPAASSEGRETAGPPQVVASGVQLGTWRPDGRAVGMTTGNWRMADWALDLDAGVVEIDEDGRPAGEVEPIVTGYHEDFSPVWSPDGRWIAYHSHRSKEPVSGYLAEGSADDIFLRRVDVPDAPEIRLTDFGWEVGNPDWAPDGRHLVMDSWERGGGGSTAWIVELDPETGAFVGRSPVPQPPSAAGGPQWEAWSPAGNELAVTYADRDGTELWVLGIDGSGARRLTAWKGGRYGGVDWTPDGRALVYAAPTDGRYRLYEISRDGGEPWLLAEDEANLLHPEVSPDGKWVAVTRMKHERRIMRAGVGEGSRTSD